MSNAEQRQWPSTLAPEMKALVEALVALAQGEMQAYIMTIAHYHGGYMGSFLRDIALYPGVQAALKKAAPTGRLKEQRDVMYAAIDYIEVHDLYVL